MNKKGVILNLFQDPNRNDKTHMDIRDFQKIIKDYYSKNKRDLAWRNTTDPYKILVSEIMLQQTQVSRILQKYEKFVKELPDFESLAKAPFSKILKVWSGLGYNRRALYLKKIAKRITEELKKEHKNKRSDVSIRHYITVEFLSSLPGIGKNTASAIVAFSKNEPVVFIETNIRRVFIHFFFSASCNPELVSGSRIAGKEMPKQVWHDTGISDSELLPLIEQTLDTKNPRKWYYALMDYGSYLSKLVENPNRKSKHYVKQSKFEGSLRQVRGKILKTLSQKQRILYSDLSKQFPGRETDFKKALEQLKKEGFITFNLRRIRLVK